MNTGVGIRKLLTVHIADLLGVSGQWRWVWLKYKHVMEEYLTLATLFTLIISHVCFLPVQSWQRHAVDFYISDFQSGLRALVRTGSGARVTPYVDESVVIDINPENKDMSPEFLRWLRGRNLSSDDRVMRLKEGYSFLLSFAFSCLFCENYWFHLTRPFGLQIYQGGQHCECDGCCSKEWERADDRSSSWTHLHWLPMGQVHPPDQPRGPGPEMRRHIWPGCDTSLARGIGSSDPLVRRKREKRCLDFWFGFCGLLGLKECANAGCDYGLSKYNAVVGQLPGAWSYSILYVIFSSLFGWAMDGACNKDGLMSVLPTLPWSLFGDSVVSRSYYVPFFFPFCCRVPAMPRSLQFRFVPKSP